MTALKIYIVFFFLLVFCGSPCTPLCPKGFLALHFKNPWLNTFALKGQVCMLLSKRGWFSPGHWMKAHSKPFSFGQSPVSSTMSRLCLEGLFMGPRYEPSMHCPRPVLLGSPHQPQSGCSRHRPHVRKPEQF